MDLKATFADRFIRLCGGCTQEEVGNAIGVKRAAVGHYQTGIRTPDSITLANIARYFGVSADYLLGLSDVKSPDVEKQAVCNSLGITEDIYERLTRLQLGKQSMYLTLINRLISDSIDLGLIEQLLCLVRDLEFGIDNPEMTLSLLEREVLGEQTKEVGKGRDGRPIYEITGYDNGFGKIEAYAEWGHDHGLSLISSSQQIDYDIIRAGNIARDVVESVISEWKQEYDRCHDEYWEQKRNERYNEEPTLAIEEDDISGDDQKTQ